MKKLSYLIALFSLIAGSVMAQEIQTEEITLKKVNKGEMPEAVLKSVEKDFPDIKVVEYALLPIEQYNDQWAIVEENTNMASGEKPQYYQIGMKGHDMKMSAVYDQNGHLVKSKETMKNIALPAIVTDAIEAQYNGWKIMEDKEVIKDNEGEINYYKVKLEKGKEKKTVFLNPEGEFLNKHKSI